MDTHRQLQNLSQSQWRRAVETARDTLLSKRLLQPRVAIVLGSGLGELANQIQYPTLVPYGEIPFFPSTTAAGHAGQLILGFLAGVPVVLMQGRAHRYEGCANRNLIFPVCCMQALGASVLISTNAAGGLNPRFRRGDLMVLDGHIDLLWVRGDWSESPNASHAVGVAPYDFALREQALRIARQLDLDLHQGTYMATLGPTYETRSEYRMFRQLGADAVGMSTIPEVMTAHRLGMKSLAFSVITNVASTETPQSTTHAEVVNTGNQAGPRLMKIVAGLLEEFAGQPD